MYAIIRSIIIFLLISKVINNMISLGIQDSDHYGPYKVDYTKFETCAGPRLNNLTTNTVAMHSEGSINYGLFNITFQVPTHLDEVKIMVYSIKDDKIDKVLWTYKLNDLCKHFAFANVINSHLNATNCIVNRGTYNVDLNFEDIQHKFFGTSFFYGKFLLKVIVSSKKGNVLCAFIGMVFNKKSEPQKL